MSAGYNYSRPPILLVQDLAEARGLEGLVDNQKVSIKSVGSTSSGEYYFDASSSDAESLPDVIVTDNGDRLIKIKVDVAAKSYVDMEISQAVASANQYTNNQVSALPTPPDTSDNANTIPRVNADESGYTPFDLGIYSRFSLEPSVGSQDGNTPIFITSNSLPADHRDVGRLGKLHCGVKLLHTSGTGNTTLNAVIESPSDANIWWSAIRREFSVMGVTEEVALLGQNPTQDTIPLADYTFSAEDGESVIILLDWEAGVIPGTYKVRAYTFIDDQTYPSFLLEGHVHSADGSPLEFASISDTFGGASFDNGSPEMQYSAMESYVPLLT